VIGGSKHEAVGIEFDCPVPGGHDGAVGGTAHFRGRPGYCLVLAATDASVVPFTAERKAAAVIAAAARGAAARMRLRADTLAEFIKTIEEYKETQMNKSMSEMAGEKRPSRPTVPASASGGVVRRISGQLAMRSMFALFLRSPAAHRRRDAGRQARGPSPPRPLVPRL